MRLFAGLVTAAVLTTSLLLISSGAMATAGLRQALKVAAAPPVIGVTHSFGPSSEGWGQVRPKTLFNGGDGSGDIQRIRWATWGGRIARGHGKNPIFKPSGGYYHRPVTIRLRATDLGTCRSSGQRAYRHLYVSEPNRPGGQFGPWRIWTSYHRNLCTHFQ
jgi:hypothetical protein